MRLFWRVVGVPALGLMALALASFGQGVTQVRLVGNYELMINAMWAAWSANSSNALTIVTNTPSAGQVPTWDAIGGRWYAWTLPGTLGLTNAIAAGDTAGTNYADYVTNALRIWAEARAVDSTQTVAGASVSGAVGSATVANVSTNARGVAADGGQTVVWKSDSFDEAQWRFWGLYTSYIRLLVGNNPGITIDDNVEDWTFRSQNDTSLTLTNADGSATYIFDDTTGNVVTNGSSVLGFCSNGVVSLQAADMDPWHVASNITSYSESTIMVTRAMGEYIALSLTNNATLCIDRSTYPTNGAAFVQLSLYIGAYSFTFGTNSISTNAATGNPPGSGGVVLTNNAWNSVIFHCPYGNSNVAWGVRQ